MEKFQLHSSPKILQSYVDKIDDLTFDQASFAFDSTRKKYRRREYQFNKFCLVYAQQKKKNDLQRKILKLKALHCKKKLKKTIYLKKMETN